MVTVLIFLLFDKLFQVRYFNLKVQIFSGTCSSVLVVYQNWRNSEARGIFPIETPCDIQVGVFIQKELNLFVLL